MTWAPATPGMSFSAAINSAHTRIPSSASSSAPSMRAMIGSGIWTPHRLAFIQRADFPERIGPMPTMNDASSSSPSSPSRAI